MRSPVSRARARLAPDVPLYAGFGISTPEHARAAAEHADGIVVGSRAVQVAEEGPAALRSTSARCARTRRLDDRAGGAASPPAPCDQLPRVSDL